MIDVSFHFVGCHADSVIADCERFFLAINSDLYLAIISLNGVVYSDSLRLGGDRFDEAIVSYVRRRYGTLIGDSTAEKIKQEVREERERKGKSQDKPGVTKSSQPGTLPAQYPSKLANKVENKTEEDVVALITHLSSTVEDDFDTDDECETSGYIVESHVTMARTYSPEDECLEVSQRVLCLA